MSTPDQLPIGQLFGTVRDLAYDREIIATLVETMRPGHGEMSISSSAETSIGAQDTFVKAAGTTALSSFAHNWTMPANNRLTYGGTSPRVVHCAASLSMTTAGNNKLTRVAVAKNGTVLAASEVKRFVATGADIGSTALHAFFAVETDDYVEIHVANGTDDTNLTLVTMNAFVMDMPL